MWGESINSRLICGYWMCVYVLHPKFRPKQNILKKNGAGEPPVISLQVV